MHAPLPAPPLPQPDQDWALFLDVDGTLVGFNASPDAVHVPPATRALLADLRELLDGALALISGRRLYDIDRLFGPPLDAVAGLHGLQLRRNDGSEKHLQPDSAVVATMRRRVDALAARMPRLRVEDKGICMALHYRQTPSMQRAVMSAAAGIVANLPDYEVQAGNHVVEIKPAGMDKGGAVEAFCDEPPFAWRMPVYIGDDLTDESAFAAVHVRGGIGVRVGDREPTEARFTLPDPAAVQVWLRQVLQALRQTNAA